MGTILCYLNDQKDSQGIRLGSLAYIEKFADRITPNKCNSFKGHAVKQVFVPGYVE